MSLNNTAAAATAVEPRHAEFAVFDKVTRALVSTKDAATENDAFQAAIDSNRRLWNALESDLSSEKNQLPEDLKAQIISLAIWVDKHSALASQGAAKIDALISVNEAIMKGLAA